MVIVIAIFAAFFGTAALLLLVFMSPGSKEAKETRSRLEQLRGPQNAFAADENVELRRLQQFSSLPWLNTFLQKLDITERLRLLLQQADLNWTVGRLLVVSAGLACAVGYPVYLRTGAAPLSLLIAAGAAFSPFAYVLRRRSARFDRMRQYLPEALDLMVSAIRAGHSLSSAMGMAANESPEPIRREFRQCFDEQNFGLELRQALLNLTHRVPVHDIRILVTAVLIQSDAGGNLTEILDKVAYLIREDFRLQRQVRTHTAQGRLTGWILSMLPPLLGVMLYLVNPDNMSILWKRSEGRAMLYAGTVMTLIGALIIRRIIRIRI
jgi:tight adherence protein B